MMNPPETPFDRITRLARHLFRVPIALISLSAGRAWLKSCQGRDVRQTAQEVSLSGHGAFDPSPLVIPDILLEGRFADNPLVTDEPGIRFYAGQPLTSADGSLVGVLCI